MALLSLIALDPSVIQQGFLNDGQQPPVAGQTASLTSGNNFINFCAQTLDQIPLTNGKQVTTGALIFLKFNANAGSVSPDPSGSCNGAPIGLIPSKDKMPSAKFVNPKNLDTIPANTNFTIQLAIKNLDVLFSLPVPVLSLFSPDQNRLDSSPTRRRTTSLRRSSSTRRARSSGTHT
jgi:hypothetical protein